MKHDCSLVFLHRFICAGIEIKARAFETTKSIY